MRQLRWPGGPGASRGPGWSPKRQRRGRHFSRSAAGRVCWRPSIVDEPTLVSLRAALVATPGNLQLLAVVCSSLPPRSGKLTHRTPCRRSFISRVPRRGDIEPAGAGATHSRVTPRKRQGVTKVLPRGNDFLLSRRRPHPPSCRREIPPLKPKSHTLGQPTITDRTRVAVHQAAARLVSRGFPGRRRTHRVAPRTRSQEKRSRLSGQGQSDFGKHFEYLRSRRSARIATGATTGTPYRLTERLGACVAQRGGRLVQHPQQAGSVDFRLPQQACSPRADRRLRRSLERLPNPVHLDQVRCQAHRQSP